eukprot:4558930-Prymnesium_polylepis.1
MKVRTPSEAERSSSKPRLTLHDRPPMAVVPKPPMHVVRPYCTRESRPLSVCTSSGDVSNSASGACRFASARRPCGWYAQS